MTKVPKKFKADKLLPLSLNDVHEYCIEGMFKQIKKKKNDSLTGIIMPDMHFGEHCEKSMNVLRQIGADIQPDMLINIGDYYGLEHISPHEKKGNDLLRCVHEIKEGESFMEKLLSDIGNPAFRFFTAGNHEYWWLRYLEDNIPNLEKALGLLGIDISMEKLVCLSSLGFEVIPFNEILKLGKAHMFHGWYTNDGHAKKHVATVGGSCFYGHTESIQSYSQVSARGVHIGQCLGTLRDPKQSKFMKKKPHAWVNSFTVIEFRRDGTFSHTPIIIIDGVASFNGKVYRG
jgi:hypothetical protein